MKKGKTVRGLEYFRAYRYTKKAGDSNEGFVNQGLMWLFYMNFAKRCSEIHNLNVNRTCNRIL